VKLLVSVPEGLAVVEASTITPEEAVGDYQYDGSDPAWRKLVDEELDLDESELAKQRREEILERERERANRG
jgi:hypothetical protein